jgi:hypothetical protein
MDEFGYHPSANLQLFIEDLAAVLPACLCNFQNLSALSISFPDDPRPLCTELVRNIFRYIPLSSLKELHLALPFTYDFATLLMQETINSSTPSRSSIKSTMKQLKDLSVSVCDGSGFGGECYYQKPPSSAQRAFPNEEYSDHFLNWFSWQRSWNLSDIIHVLNMDALDATHLYKLRILELHRVKISHTMLLSIMERNHETLRSIFLWTVELKSGNVDKCAYPTMPSSTFGSFSYGLLRLLKRWTVIKVGSRVATTY